MDAYQEQFDALVDATRRAILLRLLDGPMAVGELANAFPISRPAISQHLRVLKDAHLVTDEAAGQRRLYRVNAEGFDRVREYLERFPAGDRPETSEAKNERWWKAW